MTKCHDNYINALIADIENILDEAVFIKAGRLSSTHRLTRYGKGRKTIDTLFREVQMLEN